MLKGKIDYTFNEQAVRIAPGDRHFTATTALLSSLARILEDSMRQRNPHTLTGSIDFVLPAFRANEARSFIAGGLQDFSISRAGQPWGVPIPWDPDQVVYVWTDALVNYLSALTYARPGENLVPTFWPAVRHLLAKDILRSERRTLTEIAERVGISPRARSVRRSRA